MAGSNDFTMGSVYSFNTYAPALLGTFENVRVEGIVSHSDVRKYIDPATMHANVYSSLPENSTPNDYTKYYYLVVKQSNGTFTAIGLPWIDATSIVLKDRNTAYITVDDIGPDDIPLIKEALAANGYRAVDVRIE